MLGSVNDMKATSDRDHQPLLVKSYTIQIQSLYRTAIEYDESLFCEWIDFNEPFRKITEADQPVEETTRMLSSRHVYLPEVGTCHWRG